MKLLFIKYVFVMFAICQEFLQVVLFYVQDKFVWQVLLSFLFFQISKVDFQRCCYLLKLYNQKLLFNKQCWEQKIICMEKSQRGFIFYIMKCINFLWERVKFQGKKICKIIKRSNKSINVWKGDKFLSILDKEIF